MLHIVLHTKKIDSQKIQFLRDLHKELFQLY